MEKIAFIGTGVMGASMAKHIIEAGYELTVYNRTRDKADLLIKAGAVWADTPSEAARNVDIVITMLGYPQDVEEVYLGKDGILSAKHGGVVIDMTTSSPKLALKIYKLAKEKGVAALDAPVSGGDIGAKNATLAIMVGGEEHIFEQMKPVFEKLGKVIRYFGQAGAGQLTKLTNQIAIASNMLGVAEAIVFAQKNGLDAGKVLETITTGAAGSWSLSNLGPRMLGGDMAPGFYVKHFIKDMRIAIETAEDMQLELPGLKLAKRIYDELAEIGMENLGTQAVVKWYERQ